MVLAGEAAKSFFDVVGRGAARKPKHVVIVALRGCHLFRSKSSTFGLSAGAGHIL